MANINWKYAIGDRVIDYLEDGSVKRDLVIIDRKIERKKCNSKTSPNGHVIKTRKYYKYQCNVCGWAEGWVEQYIFEKEKTGCSCCAHMKIVKGINDIATTHPQFLQYFQNKNEAYSHSAHSDFKPTLVCPTCGYAHNNKTLHNLIRQGFSCPNCSDGISYSEKFINALLRQLDVDFLPQLSKKNYTWCERYRYDFWFQYHGEEYIIESHGRQHYEENVMPFNSLLNIQHNDKLKRDLATKNGFDDKHYIVLDCRKSERDWIRDSIIKSQLNDIFDFSTIDWSLCHANAMNSMVKIIAEYWERHKYEGTSTTEIAKIFRLDRSTVVKYLKLGNQLNWCKYDSTDELMKNLEKARSAHQKRIVFLDKNMKLLAVFNSQLEAAEKSMEILNETTPLNSQCISRACCNVNNHWYRGYYILSYEKYKQQKENDLI